MNLDLKRMEEAAQASGNYQPMPEGWYQAQIIEDKEKDTAKGGKMLSLTFSVLGKYEGEQLASQYVGRQVWGNYNVENENPKAVDIAYQELSQLAKACGITARDSHDYVLQACDIYLGLTSDNQGGFRNIIKKVRSSSSGPVETPMPKQNSQPGILNTSTPPWGR